MVGDEDILLSTARDALIKAIESVAKNCGLKGEVKERVMARANDLYSQARRSMLRITYECGKQASSNQGTPNAVAQEVVKAIQPLLSRPAAPAPVAGPSYATAFKLSAGAKVTAQIPPKRHAVVIYPEVAKGQEIPSSESTRGKLMPLIKLTDDGCATSGVAESLYPRRPRRTRTGCASRAASRGGGYVRKQPDLTDHGYGSTMCRTLFQRSRSPQACGGRI